MAQTYIVKQGDTLAKIGAKVGVSWRRLASFNQLTNPDWIVKGQVIKIPIEKTDSGDSNSPVVPVTSSGSLIDKVLGVFILYGIFQVLKKVL